jgi:hypothetical protein
MCDLQVKFDSSAAAQWTGFVTAVIGCLTWWRWWHSSAIPHLTFNPNAAGHAASTERKAVRVSAQRVARQAEVSVEERSEIQVDSDDVGSQPNCIITFQSTHLD